MTEGDSAEKFNCLTALEMAGKSDVSGKRGKVYDQCHSEDQ